MGPANNLTASHSWDAILGMTPPGARARMKTLAELADQVPFVEFALALLQSDAAAGKPGPNSMTLLDSGVVVQVICDPDLQIDQALSLAQAAALLDERIDAKILLALTSASHDWPRDIRLPQVARALELIDAISHCRRLTIPLAKFAKIADPKIRSKAVKLIARGSQNPGWMESVLIDPDPRVRCNLMEGLVSQMGHAAEPLLRRAAKDPHHRVATTALLALAQFGDAASRETLQQMATQEGEMFSRAAKWALGKLDEQATCAAIPSTTTPHPTA
jgi:hypothetical protein